MILNIYTNWLFLPWQRIYNKVNIIQKKIYKSAQYCNITIMNKYQKYLCNCNEVKILAIQHTINNIQKYYKHIDNEIYHIDDRDKFKLFQNIFNKYLLDDVATLILEKIKQYIFYLCIEPEWKSKNIVCKGFISNLNSFNITSNREYSILKSFSINLRKYYFYKENILSRINYQQTNLIQYIKHVYNNLSYKQYIYYWINNKLLSSNISNNLYESNEILISNFILSINSNTLNWHKVYTSTLDKKQNTLSINNYSYNRLVYMSSIQNIKLAISFKYRFNYLKKNINLRFYCLVDKIVCCLENTYSVSQLISKDNIKKIYNVINDIAYYWCRKKYKNNIFTKYTYIHNKFLNQYLYKSKFNLLYSIYIKF